MATETLAQKNAQEAVTMGLTDSVWAYMSKGYYLSFRRTADHENKVNFMAYVEQFSDSYNSNFTQEAVFGRTDPMQHYQNTQRSITMSWALVAYNERQAGQNLQDVNLLQHMLYPGYTDHGGQKVFKSAPIVEMSYMNLVTGTDSDLFLPGTISTFSFTPDLEFGVFESSYAVMLPKIIRVSITFNPLHKNPIGFSQKGNFFPSPGDGYPYGTTPAAIAAGRTDPEQLDNYIEKATDSAEERNLYEQFTQAKEDEILSAYNLGEVPWKSPIFGKPDGE